MALFSVAARMKYFVRAQLVWRYQNSFGNDRLTNLVLSVNLAELREGASNNVELPDAVDNTGIIRSRQILGPGFIKRIEQSAEDLLMLPFREPVPEREQEYLTRLLSEALPYCCALVCEKRDAVVSDTDTLLELYRNRDASGIMEIIKCGERLKEESDEDKEVDSPMLQKEISRLMSELEEMNLSFPFILRHKLDDPQWLEGERERLQKERNELRRLIDSLRH